MHAKYNVACFKNKCNMYLLSFMLPFLTNFFSRPSRIRSLFCSLHTLWHAHSFSSFLRRRFLLPFRPLIFWRMNVIVPMWNTWFQSPDPLCLAAVASHNDDDERKLLNCRIRPRSPRGILLYPSLLSYWRLLLLLFFFLLLLLQFTVLASVEFPRRRFRRARDAWAEVAVNQSAVCLYL